MRAWRKKVPSGGERDAAVGLSRRYRFPSCGAELLCKRRLVCFSIPSMILHLCQDHSRPEDGA